MSQGIRRPRRSASVSRAQPGGLETTIVDNGSGFDADAASLHTEVHLGLQSMRERAAILGGTVSVTSGATGTTISVHIPLESRDSEEQ